MRCSGVARSVEMSDACDLKQYLGQQIDRCVERVRHLAATQLALHCVAMQGGGNPFDMKNLMDSVKKAQQLVQTETARVQAELAA